jgi:hypothetical protein
MNKILTSVSLTCFLACMLLFSSCTKLQDAKVTFFVSNAGDAHIWADIRVDIGGQTKSFFTPENRNMVLGDCQESANAVTFYLPAGTYTYSANYGSWTGTVTVEGGDCQLINLKY